MTDDELFLRAENERLKAGEEVARKIMVEMYTDCIKGLADAATIKQQQFRMGHVAAAVKQLSETAEGWRKGYDQLKVLINELTDLSFKSEQRSDCSDYSSGCADAYSYCILQLKRVLEAYDG